MCKERKTVCLQQDHTRQVWLLFNSKLVLVARTDVVYIHRSADETVYTRVRIKHYIFKNQYTWKYLSHLILIYDIRINFLLPKISSIFLWQVWCPICLSEQKKITNKNIINLCVVSVQVNSRSLFRSFSF